MIIRHIWGKYRWAAGISLVLLVFSLILQTKICSSSLRYGEKNFEDVLRYHQSTHPLSIRYFTSLPMTGLHSLSFSLKQAFYIIQLPLLLLLSLSFYRYLLSLEFSRAAANVGLVLLWFTSPILGAFIEPMHTWDDLWTYLFLTLTFTSLVSGRGAWGAVWFTLSCFTREQSLVFLPVVVYSMWYFEQPRSISRTALLAGIPFVLYLSFYIANWHTQDPLRWELIRYNFSNAMRTRDSLFSLFVAFGFLWPAAAVSLWRKPRPYMFRVLFWGTVVAVPLTLIIGLFFARARETRIFFAPFVFIIPISLYLLRDVYQDLRTNVGIRGWLWRGGLAALLLWGGIKLAYVLFPQFEQRWCPTFQQIYAGLNLGLIFCLLTYYGHKTARRIMPSRS